MAVNEYKQALNALYDEMDQMFMDGVQGEVLVRHMSDAVDALILRCWQHKAPYASQQIDLLAVGGSGRCELAPLSDWDIWFLVPEKIDDTCQKELESFLYELWDMGAKLGHAVRSLKESMDHIKNDWESTTAALEMRLLAGSGEQYRSLQMFMRQFIRRKKKSFVEAKLKEVESRHKQTGNTAFLMEPDIKENKGGLRDVQAVFWMMKAWYEVDTLEELQAQGAISEVECKHLLEAQNFLWRCRVGLHLERRRASDRLGFEQQAMLADKMGYQSEEDKSVVEVFMKQYFRFAGRIGRVSGMLFMDFRERLNPKLFAFEKNIGDGFVLQGKQLSIRDADVFKEDPVRLLRIFHATQRDHRVLSSAALRQIREDVLLIDDDFRANPEAHQVLMQILRDQRNVAWALREMNNTGVLGRFIPAFRDVVGLGQFNRYHAYTVDEHTIRAVGEARNFFHKDHTIRLPLAHDVWHKIKRPELLYMALIFHDIAKGMQGDHSVNGEILAREFCQSIGMTSDASELVAWLVRWHLHMAVVSQRFDLSDQSVIQGFANDVVDMERLNYLFLLTVADIAAVGPNVWNDWKGSLLSELYHSTAHCLMGGQQEGTALQERIEHRISSTLGKATTNKSEVTQALKLLPSQCLLHFPPRQLLALADVLTRSNGQQQVAFHVDKVRSEMLVMVVAEDKKGLFSMLAASLTSGHIHVISAQAYHLKDGRVFDVFHIQDQHGEPFIHESDQARIQRKIEVAMSGKIAEPPADNVKKLNILMRQVPVRVRELPTASNEQTVIEVAAADRAGLLARLLWAISEEGYDLRGATVSTFGERAVDVFFVQGKQQQALTTEQVEVLREKLKAVAKLPEVDA